MYVAVRRNGETEHVDPLTFRFDADNTRQEAVKRLRSGAWERDNPVVAIVKVKVTEMARRAS